MNILFVCSGNVSRSFLAEMVLEHEIQVLGLHNVAVSSAGLFAYEGSPPDPVMVEYLEKTGVLVKGHVARQLTREDLEWADRILVMERDHKGMIEERWPHAKDRVELLSRFTSGNGDYTGDDIADPFGRSPYHYRLAQSQITLAIKSFVKRVLVQQG